MNGRTARERLEAAPTRGASRIQLLKFCLVGAAGYVVNLCAFALSMALGGQELIAAAAAFAIAVAGNFWCNRRWTFAASDRAPGLQAARFFVVSVAAFLFAAVVLQLLVELAGVPSLPAQAASIVAATPLSFLGNKLWSFGDRRPGHRGGRGRRRTPPGPTPGWSSRPTTRPRTSSGSCATVLPQLAAAASEHHVLIVDDSSPDGTGEIADRLAAELDAVQVLHRPEKDGLGRAYAAGFGRALAEGAELVMQMDADFSHDPEQRPRADRGRPGRRPRARVALRGRRRGGRLGARPPAAQPRRLLVRAHRPGRAGQGPHRRLQVLPARLLERLGLSGLETAGFGFQIEVTYRALQSGARVREVPIRFRDRQVGVSKMSSRIVVEALCQVLALRLRRERPGAARGARAADPAEHLITLHAPRRPRSRSTIPATRRDAARQRLPGPALQRPTARPVPSSASPDACIAGLGRPTSDM